MNEIESFLNYKRYLSGSKTTEVTYRSIMNDFAVFCRGQSLTLSLIDSYALYVMNQNFKPKTVHNKLAVVRSYVKYLYSRNLTDIRPEAIELPRLFDTEANFLTPEEQKLLLAVIGNPRDRAIIHTLLASGLRVSEIVNLKYDDLYEKSLVVNHGKGGKSRVTFITDACKTDIILYLKTKRRTEYLFTGRAGQLSRQYIARIVTEYAITAGIKKHVSPHTLRHSFATNLLQNGARVEVTQKLMGHANIRTTLIYMHFTDPYLHSEYDKFSLSKY